jgi:RNA polymerase sigma-B factor
VTDRPAARDEQKEEVDSLFREFRRTGDAALRDRIIAEHLYLVQAVARKFAGLGESHEDLLQEGAMGLVNAVDLYDLSRGVRFATYASHLIEGQIRHYLRDKGALIRQPAWVQELGSKIGKAADSLAHRLARSPTVSEIAKHLRTSEASVAQVIKAREGTKVSSLDAPKPEDGKGGGGGKDLEKIVVEPTSRGLEDLAPEDRIFLREAIGRLKALERQVVHLFYYLDLNQTEIARRLGISVNYASYLLRSALAKLRDAYQNQAAQVALLEAAPEPAVSPYSLSWRAVPTDPVTQTASADYFSERVEQELQRAQRYPQSFALLLLELQMPPEVHGSERGALLAKAARLIRRNVRSIDLVAHVEENTFGLLLPHTGRQASVLGERLCARLRELASLGGRASSPSAAEAEAGAGPLAVSASAGFAVYPHDGSTLEHLLTGARRALEAAWAGGGNQVCRGRRPDQGRAKAAGPAC